MSEQARFGGGQLITAAALIGFSGRWPAGLGWPSTEQLAIEGLTFDDDEDAWIDHIAANMAAILTVGSELGRVFGRTRGLARETHITKALRLLKKHGRIPSTPTGSKQHAIVIAS